MATLSMLITSGSLELIEVDLDPDILPQRCLYAFPSVIRWLEEVLPTLAPEWGEGKQTPLEQVDFLFSQFIAGGNVSHWQACHIMKPQPGDHHIWELKTKDVRFFGWFPKKDIFVIAQAESAKKVKEHGLYRGMRNACVQCREWLDLDEPKAVVGGYEDVLSSKD
jgi:hypothetical protein